MAYPYSDIERRPAFSIPSLIAVGAAILSFFVSAGWALLLAIFAIIFGAIGVLVAFAPNRRGGIVSTLSVLLGALGIIVAIVRLLL